MVLVRWSGPYRIGSTLSQASRMLFCFAKRPVCLRYGNEGYQWFSLQDRSPEKFFRVKETAPILNDFIDDEMVRYGVNSENCTFGFSQGTMMGLFGPREDLQACGIFWASIAPKIRR